MKIFWSCLSTYVLAICPPKEPEVAHSFKQNWSQFFLRSPNPEQNKGPAPQSDVAPKDQIDNYFLNPLPGYEAFNKWFYKALDNGAQSIYEAIKESYMDTTFEPPTQLTNTPFPIPVQFQRVYSWLQRKNPSLNVPTNENEHKKKVDSHFGGTVKPIFDEFYKWFYDKQAEDDDWKQHFEDSKKLKPPKFRDLAGTPFPIPKKFHVYYYYEMMHPNSTINRHNESISFDNADLDESISQKMINKYFGYSVPPEYDDFYRWFYHQQHDDENWLKKLNLAQQLAWFNPSYNGYVLPIAVPPEYLSYYILSEARPNDTHNDFHPTDSPTELDKILSEANLFGDYDEFREWLGEISPFRRNVLKKVCELTQNNPIKTNTSTPFLVPEPLRDAFCWVISNDDDKDATDNNTIAEIYHKQLEEFFKKPILPIHDLFYQWFYKALNDKERVNARLATDKPVVLDFNQWLRFTPFPVPAEHLHDFAYINALESFLNISTKSPRSKTNPPAKAWYTVKLQPYIGETTTEARFNIKLRTAISRNDPNANGIPVTQPYHEFTQWINKVFNNDEKLLADKIRESQLDFKFNLKDISTPTPFPIPFNYIRFYHWLNTHLEDLKKPTVARLAALRTDSGSKKTEFAQWLNKIFNNDQAVIAAKLRECQADYSFQTRNIRVTAPFEVPLQYYRFYHWINSQLHPEDYVTQEPPSRPEPAVYKEETANTKPRTSAMYFHTQPMRMRPNTKTEYDEEDEGPPPTTPSYIEFTKWLNEILDHKRDLITQKIKECQHDQDFDPRGIKEPTPFPVPIRFFRFYHWLNSKVKAGEHKKEGVIHTAPPTRYDTTGKPGVSFMSTQAFPEYTKWLFDLFKNNPKLINEKLKECQQDPTFNPRAIKATTPFPVPIRHFRLFHWINSKLHPDEYTYPADKVTRPSPMALEPTYSLAREADSVETTTLKETTTDAPVPSTKSYLQFTKWLNEILDDNAKLIAQKMKECQHDQEFNPREINGTTPFPVPIHHFRFYHWLNSKYKAGEHKKKGIIHTAPAIRHATTGKPGVSFMTTQAYPEFSQWLFNLFKNDQKLINQKLEECRQDQDFNMKANKTITSAPPFQIPVRFYRFYHWMNSKLKSTQQTSKMTSSVSRHSTVPVVIISTTGEVPGQAHREFMKAVSDNLRPFVRRSVHTNATISSINFNSTLPHVGNSSRWHEPEFELHRELMEAMNEDLQKYT